MYRDASLREHQYYVYPDWMGTSVLDIRAPHLNFYDLGGVYGSPSLSGSRYALLILHVIAHI